MNPLDFKPGLGSVDILKPSEVTGTSPTGTDNAKSKVDFGKKLSNSINKLADIDKDAQKVSEDFLSGKTTNIHETMIAIEKADVSFRLMMAIRNKMIQAYQEIMRIQM